MKTPLSWLKAYVDITGDPRELARRMTLAGVEAESVTVVGGAWDNVVVGRVTKVEPHPNADRLRLATVDTGAGEETVVCGAPNVAAGQKIAFARVGAQLIDAHSGKPAALKAARIRGVESRGMVCSARELGLSQEHEGILVLSPDAPAGAPLAQVLGDVLFDWAVTPNRPDCMSVLGIAREVAALTGKAVREPEVRYPEAGEPVERLTSVQIEAPDLCPRYIAAVVTGVTVKPSPAWMQDRLNAAGMRPINNIVDITNYVMLEYGQPLHAFDYDKLGERRIVVRRARAGETITSIDGQVRTLTPDMLAICDAARPVAIAGVMGGAEREVGEGTRTVLLESAAFHYVSIRNTSRALGLRSEASMRFEKGLSQELPLVAARRAVQLLIELAGGATAKGMADAYPGRAARPALRLTAQRLQRILGVTVPMEEAARVLTSLGFACERDGAQALNVHAPYWRTDASIEDDLIEEVVRIKGYDWAPTTTRAGQLPAYDPDPMLDLKESARDILAAAGMQEVVTYSLTSRSDPAMLAAGASEGLRLANPLSADLEVLRTSMRGALLRTLAGNQRHQEAGVRLFETGRVYLPRKEDLPEERDMLAGVLSGRRSQPSWQAESGELGFFDAKGVLEGLFAALGVQASYQPAADPMLHPGRTAGVSIGGARVGVIGELHPQAVKAFDLLDRPVAWFEIDLPSLLLALPSGFQKYQPLPRFPGVLRDLAIVVDAGVPAQQVQALIQGTPLVREVTLFDIYTGDRIPAGKKSLAYRIVYQAPNRTLTSEETDRTQEKLLARLAKELGATLRA